MWYFALSCRREHWKRSQGSHRGERSSESPVAQCDTDSKLSSPGRSSTTPQLCALSQLKSRWMRLEGGSGLCLPFRRDCVAGRRSFCTLCTCMHMHLLFCLDCLHDEQERERERERFTMMRRLATGDRWYWFTVGTLLVFSGLLLLSLAVTVPESSPLAQDARSSPSPTLNSTSQEEPDHPPSVAVAAAAATEVKEESDAHEVLGMLSRRCPPGERLEDKAFVTLFFNPKKASLSFSLPLSLTLPHSLTLSSTHSHTHSLPLPLPLPLPFSLLSLSLSLSLLSLSLSLSLHAPLSPSLSPSLSLTLFLSVFFSPSHSACVCARCPWSCSLPTKVRVFLLSTGGQAASWAVGACLVTSLHRDLLPFGGGVPRGGASLSFHPVVTVNPFFSVAPSRECVHVYVNVCTCMCVYPATGAGEGGISFLFRGGASPTEHPGSAVSTDAYF